MFGKQHITCFKTFKEIEIKQQDKYCTVKEIIQFRPATYDELRRQLNLRSDSLGASGYDGYVHIKDKNRKVSTGQMEATDILIMIEFSTVFTLETGFKPRQY